MAIKDIGTGIIDELIVSGNTEIHTKAVELAAGGLKRGQLIGKSEAGAFGAVDGTHTEAYGILTADVAEGETNALVYVSGHFNANKITGYVEETHYDALREKGIFVEKALAY